MNTPTRPPFPTPPGSAFEPLPFPPIALRGAPRLYCFTYGYEPIPESLSLLGGRQDVFMLEPVTGAAVAYDDGWVLLDTGFNTGIVRDPVKRAAHYNFDSYTAVVPPGEPLLDQVAAAGLDMSELAVCAVSHLHCDHAGGLRHLVGGPPVVLHSAELAFGLNGAEIADAYFREDYDIPGIAYHLIDGPVELAPGLSVLPTPGHTPGHLSFRIDLPETGSVVMACDSADLVRNVTGPVPCGTTTHTGLAAAAKASVEQLNLLHNQVGTQVWPGHDPEFWATRLRPPLCYH